MRSRLLAGMAGAGIAIACAASTANRPLPHAGARNDDGTGLLARFSRGQPVFPDCENCTDDNGQYGAMYGDDPYALMEAYGGVVYGPGLSPEAIEVPDPVVDYTGGTVNQAGAIVGVVTWHAAPGVPATIPGCGGNVPNPTLSVGAQGGVRDAVVYLVDISNGKPPATVGGTLQEASCALHPHVQIAGPIGAVLSIGNEDDHPHAIDLRAPLAARRTPQVLAPRREIDLPLLKQGFYEASGDAGGWVVVPPHPYYTVTDGDGKFRLDDVPPGEYTIAAWHEAPIIGADGSRGKSVEIHTRVKVVANQVTTAGIDLK